MKKINLAEVLLKEMAVFDCKSFESKEEMFEESVKWMKIIC